jgi:ABC-type antimicrobial peptide transport system ATPase subunit
MKFAIFAFTLCTVRAITNIAYNPSIQTAIRLIFGYMSPAIIAILMTSWRTYIVEYSFRVRFIKSKMIEKEMEKLANEKQNVRRILNVMLPEVSCCFEYVLFLCRLKLIAYVVRSLLFQD